VEHKGDMDGMLILKTGTILFKNNCEIFDKNIFIKVLLYLEECIFRNYLCDQGFEF